MPPVHPSPSFKTVFNKFCYSFFVHVYEVLCSYSPPFSLFCRFLCLNYHFILIMPRGNPWNL
jgi:hypothetical protein